MHEPKQTKLAGQFKSELSPEALALRQFNAYKMRLAGASFDDIGRVLGVSRFTAARDVSAVHANLQVEAVEDIEALRQQEAARLDIALFAIMPAVKKGNLFAVDRLIAIEKRRAELLGLDAARKMELTGKDGGAIQTENNIRERWTPQEAALKAQELLRRMEIAQRATSRVYEMKAQPQAGDERN